MLSDFNDRLVAIERRLEHVAERPSPAGMTEPDPDTPDERWQAAHVWAHMAEFVGYWQKQMGFVIARYDGTPVPFGRTKRDEARAEAIERGRREPVALLIERVRTDLARLRRYLAALREEDWQMVGRHPTLGVMPMPRIVERFLINHLDEHLKQLEGLAAGEGHADS